MPPKVKTTAEVAFGRAPGRRGPERGGILRSNGRGTAFCADEEVPSGDSEWASPPNWHSGDGAAALRAFADDNYDRRVQQMTP
jgi:hypothetical protein